MYIYYFNSYYNVNCYVTEIRVPFYDYSEKKKRKCSLGNMTIIIHFEIIRLFLRYTFAAVYRTIFTMSQPPSFDLEELSLLYDLFVNRRVYR